MRPFDINGEFCPNVKEGEVLRLAVRAAGVTVLSGGTGLAVQAIGTVILARLLAPSDFGLVTMVTTFSLLLMNFGGNGFTEVIIQREKINHFQVSNLFWINIGIGLLLTLGFAGAGSLLARLYRDPLVAHVAVGMSATIFMASTSVQHQALLKRAMYFSATSTNEVLSRAASLLVSLSLAWAGWGYWALVAGAIAQSLSQSIGAWFLCRWIPSFPRRLVGTASMVRFAMSVYGRFTVNYFARNTDNLLVGWRFGAISLGFYKKAYDLFALSAGQLTAPLTNVAVSALSRFNPRSIQYRQNLLSALSVLAFVGMGLSVGLTLAGKDFIRLLLGPRWAPSGSIFTFFAPGIGAMLLYYVHGWIHLSIGRADRWFRWGLIEVTVTCLSFLLGLSWGPVGVAVAWAASFWMLTIPALWYAGRPIQFGIAPILASIWRYIVAALLAGFATAVIIREIATLRAASGSALGGIAINSLLFGSLYIGAVVWLHRGWEPLYQVAALLRVMISRGPAPTVAPVCDANKPLPAAFISESATSIPMVSILIPAFNAQEWLADAIRSALAQTWQRKEIIVVDDGSSDQTLAIARQFESEYLRVVTQNNQGAAAARNKAFSLSQGDYIQWLDADDLLAPDKIARQMEVASQCPSKRTLFSSAWGKFMYRHYRAKFVPTALWSDLLPVDWLLLKMANNIYMQTSSWLVSRELAEAAGPWNSELLGDDDGEYFCRVLLASDGVRFVPEAKVYYRTPWFTSLSYIGHSEKKRDAHWRSMQLHISHLRSLEDSERVRQAAARYLQTSMIYFHPGRPDIIKQAEKIAKDLGRQLTIPRLRWKYAWIKTVLGWRAAKYFQTMLPIIRWSFERRLDKLLFRIETRNLATKSETIETEMDASESAARDAEPSPSIPR